MASSHLLGSVGGGTSCVRGTSWIIEAGLCSKSPPAVGPLSDFVVLGFVGLDAGFGVLDFGLWALDFGLWFLDFGPYILDLGGGPCRPWRP